MALSQSSPDDVRDASRVVTPRWVTPALFALWGAAAIAEFLTGHVVTGMVLGAAFVVALLIAIIFRRQLRAFNQRRAAASQATYGSLAIIGVGWMLLGIWRLVPPASDVVLGWVCIGMGLMMVIAYAPGYFRLRSVAPDR
jgi:hypothetical protein